ncbi:GGDEF domain-containing protein [Pseudomonas sp. BTN1]|uniref:GGDEF domain-containing protein n=1 Tax=Pseudomonas sp. BTN1 TaxID=1750647 RepID=UPI0009F8E157|nr:GGDEF domain-containing protein [Pseudomonas sp. BTN1]
MIPNGCGYPFIKISANMKIDKLKIFYTELNSEFISECEKCEVHFNSNKNWTNILTLTAADSSDISSLEKSISEPVSYHASNSLTAWFHIADSNVTVSLKFAKSPQIEKRRKYRARIEKIHESASNAYKVSHHPLTHLLAKDEFRKTLLAEILEISKLPSSFIVAQESKHPRKLAVMALDIDYFKQVNDTWGHLYGDQVLKTFGKRLEDAALTIQGETQYSPSAYVGHPSGEEFLILVSANATKEQFKLWADAFRTSISDEVLPTQKEWDWLSQSSDTTALSLPQTQDRTITTSIGIALHNHVPSTDSTLDPSAILLDRADTALYRAKAAGRNQAIFYDEILSSCGRILEQDVNTGVIAIDIGSNVGVSIGQEFKVFNPKFSGERKFSINDGRTTRTLGTYPRVESARIVVFDCQPEVSFASIDSIDDTSKALEFGSTLEAIPAGSIGHLLPHASRYFPAINDQLRTGGVQAIQDFVKTNPKTNKPYALVIRFTREPEYLRKYGTAALNNSLARLYRAAQTAFQNSRNIEVLDRSSICVVGTDKSYNNEAITNFVEHIADELPELGVAGGVLCHEDMTLFTKKDITLDPANIIELARFAASEFGREAQLKVRHFTPKTPAEVFNALREARSFEIAYTDFERLISLGVKLPDVYNQGGLISSGLGHRDKSLKHFHAALKLSPKEYIYKTNFGTVAYALNEIELGLEILNTLTDEEVERSRTGHAYGYTSYASLLASAKLGGLNSYSHARFTAMAPIALGMTDIAEYANSNINKALLAVE